MSADKTLRLTEKLKFVFLILIPMNYNIIIRCGKVWVEEWLPNATTFNQRQNNEGVHNYIAL